MKGGSQARSVRKGPYHTWVDRLFDPVITYSSGVELMVVRSTARSSQMVYVSGCGKPVSIIKCGSKVHVFHARLKR